MKEETARVWELVVKVGGALVFLAGALFSYQQYLETANREARKPFLQRQLDLCVEAADSAAIIATARVQRPDDVTKARARFHRLYYGSLAIFDNAAIGAAMDKFKALPADAPDQERQHWAVEIAHACRDLTIFSWNVQYPGEVLERIRRDN